MNKPVRLFAELKEVEYAPQAVHHLNAHPLAHLTAGRLASHSCFALTVGNDRYGFSQWLSPKRTRSYPLARVYKTLGAQNRITLIPFCKDEGRDGDRDFIQWDTVSLMSLLNVYVIIGFYTRAVHNVRPRQQHKDKITGQGYDYAYVGRQVKQLRRQYQSSALHWNIRQMEQLSTVAKRTLNAYRAISAKTGVLMHGEAGIEKRIDILNRDIHSFKNLSRTLAQEAQHRENKTVQPKEKVVGNKVSITMKNLLGGYYFMTADEGMQIGKNFFLIEKKHSRRSALPSMDDILDSFVKMMLFVNIAKLELGGKTLAPKAMVGLSSPGIKGVVHSRMSDDKIRNFIRKNSFSDKNKTTLLSAIKEARHNQFGVFVINSAQMDNQDKILSAFA